MANPSSAYEVTTAWRDPRSAYWASHYLKKLLIERHAIRAALEHPGGSVITAGPARAADADELPSYSPVIGNDFHLDLLQAEQEIATLQKRDRIELLAWCDGLSPKEAAQWANINGGKIRSREPKAMHKRVEATLARVAGRVKTGEAAD
jgi:DNA-directed RNA polymerase specialized sigma24 family protein